VMLLAGVSPVIARRVGTKWVVAGGLSLFTAGLLVVAATFGVDRGYTLVFFTMLAMGAGMGLAMAPATESVMGSLPKEKAGVGSAMSDTTRELGGTLGVAVGGSALAAVYASQLGGALSAAPLPPEAAEVARHSISGAYAVAEEAGAFSEPLRAAAREAFVLGLRADVLISAAVCLAAVVVAVVFLPSRATEPEPARATPVTPPIPALPDPTTRDFDLLEIS
jgi:MFS family permease